MINISFDSSVSALLFIVLGSIYVCSILWIYGDAVTRDAGKTGLILPIIYILCGAFILHKGALIVLAVWPIGIAAWFFLRPKNAHAIIE